METIYSWIGFFSFWAYLLIFSVIISKWLIENFFNYWAKISKFPWRMFEYIYYRKEFKEWIKDKERHFRLKDETYGK